MPTTSHARGNVVNYVELDGHFSLVDDVGGVTPADLPTQTTPPGAPPEVVAGSYGARARELDRLADEFGCKFKNGPGALTTTCQNLLRELARARGNTQRAIAALMADPSIGRVFSRALKQLARTGASVGRFANRNKEEIGFAVASAVVIAVAPEASLIVSVRAAQVLAKVAADVPRLANCLQDAVRVFQGSGPGTPTSVKWMSAIVGCVTGKRG